MRARPATGLACFAITAPGLEPIAAGEISALGIAALPIDGGVEFTGTLDDVARANLWLRTVSRVLVRVEAFRARTFFELERQASRIAWDRYIVPGSQVTFRVTCRKSALYHSDAVAQRLFQAVAKRLPNVAQQKEDAPDVEESRAQLFVVRLFKDVCTVSADSSGDLLHRRGYRKAVAKAPLRETLAASLLLAANWSRTALEDPFCGSGTVAIEAALIARRIAPGLHRSFAFQGWADYGAERLESLRAQARETILPRSPVAIVGADRDAGAIRSAIDNAQRAGVAEDVEFETRAVSDLEVRPPPGLIVTNPPYGVRVGEAKQLRNLYARFGDVLRHNRPGWDVAMLASDAALVRRTRLHLETVAATTNGGIRVRILTGTV